MGIPNGCDADVVVGSGDNGDVPRCGMTEDGFVVQDVDVHVRHGGGIFSGVCDIDLGLQGQA